MFIRNFTFWADCHYPPSGTIRTSSSRSSCFLRNLSMNFSSTELLSKYKSSSSLRLLFLLLLLLLPLLFTVTVLPVLVIVLSEWPSDFELFEDCLCWSCQLSHW